MRTTVLMLLSFFALSAASSDSAADKEVVAAMEAYKQAYIHGDAAAMDKLLSSDLSYSHTYRPAIDKEEFVKSVTTGPLPQLIEYLPDTKVRIDGAMAFVTGHEDLGGPESLKHCYVTRVFEKTAQGWLMVARQSTLISIERSVAVTIDTQH